jgi:hypothetical protein
MLLDTAAMIYDTCMVKGIIQLSIARYLFFLSFLSFLSFLCHFPIT